MSPEFTLEDFRRQLQQFGPAGDVVATGSEYTKQSLRRIQGMIDAMTREERGRPDMLDEPRRRRIAAGAGVQPRDVERFLRQFRQVRVLVRQMAELSIWREGGA